MGGTAMQEPLDCVPDSPPPFSLAHGRLCVVLAALLWSTSGAFTKLLTKDTGFGLDQPALDPLQLAFARPFFAGLALLPLLRRGAPYGEQFIQGKNTATDRGLLGLFFCASIEEQFEHLLGNWANNNPMGMPFRQHGKDPIIGNHERIGNGFEIPLRTGGPLVIEGLGAFVQTRGTCYAFFPSLPSLLKIAKGRIATSTLFLEET